MARDRGRPGSATNKNIPPLGRTQFKHKARPNTFHDRRFDPTALTAGKKGNNNRNNYNNNNNNRYNNKNNNNAHYFRQNKRVQNLLNNSGSVEYLHFREEVSNYGHLSDSPLPITPWYSQEEFEEIMGMIYDSVHEVPKQLPPGYTAEHGHELFFARDVREKVVYARLKVRTWKLRSMNIEDAHFLTEFLACLERLLDYLIAKSFQRKRLAPMLYNMKTTVVTGFITALEQTLGQNYHFLGRSSKASKLFDCPKWILQIRHKVSHNNSPISEHILEDAISFIFCWFRGNFEFHLKKMPADSYEEGKEYYQHRSFSNSAFNHKDFCDNLTDLFYGKMAAAEETAFLKDARHFARYDLNKFLCFFVKTIDLIHLVKKDAPEFEFFMPAIRKLVKPIFMDVKSDIFCLKFLNRILDQIVKYEKMLEDKEKLGPESVAIACRGRDRLFNFMYMFVRAIIGKNADSKQTFFHIYRTERESDCLRWTKLAFRLVRDLKHFFPESSRLIVFLFNLGGDGQVPRDLKSACASHVRNHKIKHFPEQSNSIKKLASMTPRPSNNDDDWDNGDDEENQATGDQDNPLIIYD